MSLLEDRVVSIRGRVSNLRAKGVTFGPKALVEHDASGPELVVGEDLVGQFVDELVEAQIHLQRDRQI